MDNYKITIKVLLVFTYALFTMTSCVEDPFEETQEILPSGSKVPFGPDLSPDPNKIVDTPELITIYIQWHPWVSHTNKAAIRSTYSDINGELYLETFTTCINDSTVESWKVLHNPINPPKDRTPDPLVILNDHEDEMKNNSLLIIPCL